MKVILHAGVHCTDNDRLVKGLLRNADLLRQHGVAVPGPGRYRTLLTEVVNELDGAPPAPGARDVVLDEILFDDPESVSRLVLSHENFFCVPKLMFGGRKIYRKAEGRIKCLSQLFDGDDIELFLALRDPASFLPAAFSSTPLTEFGEFMDGVDPAHLRWSDFVGRVREAVPEVKITAWCNEDIPLIWGSVLRAMAGLPDETKIVGAFDMLSEVMAPEGMRRFRAYLGEHPTINEIQKRRVMVAFLSKYGMVEAVEEELDLPGWTVEYVEALTQAYDADVANLSGIEGVQMILP